MGNLLRILLVEDSEDDAILLIRHLQRNGYDVVYDRVVDSTSMIESLRRQPWDIVIADYALPAFNGLSALAIFKESKIDIPFIIVSGTIGEDIAIQAMKAGAHDYVMKGNLARLIPAIQRELDEAEIRRERRHGEDALKESENRYRGLFEGSKDAIYFSTVDGKLIDINPAGVELLGYTSKEEILAANVYQCNFYDSIRYNRRKKLIQEGGSIKDFEYTLKRKDGTSAIVLETTTPVQDIRGTVIMYRSILRDVTMQKQLEQQFIQAQKMDSIGTLAGGIAHDFNNILGIILGYSNLLEEKRTHHKEFSESVSAIVQAAERGSALVQQILTFARKTDVTFRQINLANAACEMLAMLKDTFPRIITMKGVFSKKIPNIYADGNQIHQVLLNLCLNARDAMPNGGQLTLKTEVRTLDQVREHFPAADQEAYVCLSVSDTGEGMDETIRPRIFDPFFTTKTDGKGAGLGLSVVYGVMQAHLGFIDVESKPKHGSVFRLYFPVPATTTHQAARQTQKDFFKLEGTETILFVEDEEFIRNMVRLTLESKGYKVYTAEDGISAIRLYKRYQEEIDLVLTDIGLPGMTGIDEFMKLKKIDPDVNVVFTSGFLEPELRNKLLADGAKAFVQKPFQAGNILKIIRGVLDKKPSKTGTASH
ncbi:MAG: response regulator [Ignavibacteriae bacterium]|nr:MAG: response regulator [Ignavibacteriota bacterium]